jgi:hypothetical protein
MTEEYAPDIECQELPKNINIIYACILQGMGHFTQVKGFDAIIRESLGEKINVTGFIFTGETDNAKIPDVSSLGVDAKDIIILPTLRFETEPITGGIDSTKTVINGLTTAPKMIWHSATTLRKWIGERLPQDDDSVTVIADFYGGIVGLSSLIGTLPKEVLHLPFATQFQIMQDDYYFPPRNSFDGKVGLEFLNKTNSGRSTRYAISVKPFDDINIPNSDGSFNMPPLIPLSFMNSVENLPEKKDKILMYLLNPGFIEDIINWSNLNPDQELIVYTAVNDTIKLANGEIRKKSPSFNQEMLESKVLISSGGVQTPIEAILANCLLGLFPTPNHSEQLSNTINAARNWKLANMVSESPIRLLNWGKKMLKTNEDGINRYQEITYGDDYIQKRQEMLAWIKSAQTAYPEIFTREVFRHLAKLREAK